MRPSEPMYVNPQLGPKFMTDVRPLWGQSKKKRAQLRAAFRPQEEERRSRAGKLSTTRMTGLRCFVGYRHPKSASLIGRGQSDVSGKEVGTRRQQRGCRLGCCIVGFCVCFSYMHSAVGARSTRHGLPRRSGAFGSCLYAAWFREQIPQGSWR